MSTPNPNASAFDAAIAQNPTITQDPALAYPLVSSQVPPTAQQPVVNAAQGQYLQSYLSSLPTDEQPIAFASLTGTAQQLAVSQGYTDALSQQQVGRVQAPQNAAGKSWLSRVAGDIGTVVGAPLGAAWNAASSVLSVLGKPLNIVQRAANAGILDVTDLVEGHGISPLDAWNQAGNAPMTQDSMDSLTAKYGQGIMDMVRQAQTGQDPQQQIAALVLKGKTDPANLATYQAQAEQIEATYKSPAFTNALIEANNHLISPGRIVASWAANALSGVTGGNVDLYTHKALFGLLSGPVDALFDFNADPVMWAAKAWSEAHLLKYGAQFVEGGAKAVAGEVAGAAEGVAAGAGEAAAGAATGAELGAEGGTAVGPEGTVGGALVGGAAGAIAGAASFLFNWGEKGGSTKVGHAIAQTLVGQDGAAPISDLAGFSRYLDTQFTDPNVRRYFDGLGSHVQTILDSPTSVEAGQAMTSLRRDYPRYAPYLDALVSQQVTSADKAQEFLQSVKGFQSFVQGTGASRVPLMAYRTALQAAAMKYVRPSMIFDFLENGSKLTQDTMPDLHQNLSAQAAQLTPEARAAAAANPLLAQGTTAATDNLTAARQLAQAQEGWRGRAATAMRRYSSKVPDFNQNGDLELWDEGSQNTKNFTNFVKLWAPSWYADRMGATFAAADLAGRREIYKSAQQMMFDSSGMSKTAQGRDVMNRLQKAIDTTGYGKYSFSDVGRTTDGRPVAWDPNKARTAVPAIDAKTFFAQAAKHGVFAHMTGWTDKQMVDTLVDSVWRPSVLLRPAFIFRSSIEEAVNHVFRVGMLDKIKGAFSRSALNEISLQQKNKLGTVAAQANQKFTDFNQAVLDLHGGVYGQDLAAHLRTAAAAPGADSQELRSVANKWENLRSEAAQKKTDYEAHPGVFDPDHSRLMRFMLAPVTRGAQAATAVWRKVPLDMEFHGVGFKTYGAQVRDDLAAHEATRQELSAKVKDAYADYHNADTVFEQKYGRTVPEARAVRDDLSQEQSVRRLAQRQLRTHESNKEILRNDLGDAQQALKTHGVLPESVRKARDNMVQGYVDQKVANWFHFMGKVGLGFMQRMSPQDIQHLVELAESKRGQEIVAHTITEMSARTAKQESVDQLDPGDRRGQLNRVKLGEFGEQTTAGKSGAHSWSWALDDLADNPLAHAAMLNMDDPSKAIQAVKDTLAAHPEWHETLPVLQMKTPDEFANQVHTEVLHHLSAGDGPLHADDVHRTLNRDLWDSMIQTDPVTGLRSLNRDAFHPDALNTVPDAFRPQRVFGQDSMLAEDTSSGGFITRLAQYGFQRVGSWISYLSRQDQYVREYVNLRNVMKPWEELQATHLREALDRGAADEAGHVPAKAAQANAVQADMLARKMVIDHATEQAWYRTLRFLDHPGTRTQSAVLMRNMAPFWRAEQGFMARWATSFRYSPAMIQKMDLAANYVKSDAIEHKDADGNRYFTIPMTGQLQWVLGKIGTAAGVDMLKLPIPDRISGNLLLSSPGFNVDFLKHPITGPVVMLPLQAWDGLTHNSTADMLVGGLGGSQAQSQGQSTTQMMLQLMPSILRPLAKFAVDNKQITTQNFVQAIAYLQASGHGLPPNASSAQKQQFIDRVHAHALGLGLMQALSTPFMPAPEHNEGPVPLANVADQAAGLHTVKDEFTRLVADVEKGGGSYTDAYQYWVEAHPDEIPFLAGANQSNSEATIPETAEAFTWMADNQDLLKAYPLAASFLIPQTGTTFSYAPYALSQQLGLVSGRTETQALAHLQATDNLQTYYDMQDAKNAALKGLGSDTTAAQHVRAQYAPVEQMFLFLHPDVAAEVSQSGDRTTERNDTVQQMAQLLNDPRTKASPEATTMANFVNLWGSFQSDLLGIVARGTARTQQEANLKANFDATAQQLASQSGPTGTMLYQKLFKYMESSNIQGAMAVGE